MTLEIGLLAFAICCNLLLLLGVLTKNTTLFLPWMMFYGLELFCGWCVGITFMFISSKYPLGLFWVFH